MSRSMRVTVVLEFDNVQSIESEIADIIIQNITASTDEMAEVFNADAVWVDNAEIRIEYGKGEAA
jgi:hypothetical protein